MGMRPGTDDLKAREIVGFNGQGQALVLMSDNKVLAHRLFMIPGGSVRAEPVKIDNTPDQIGGQPVGERVPVADRWRGVDQA